VLVPKLRVHFVVVWLASFVGVAAWTRASMGSFDGALMVPLAAVLGPFVGLTASAPYQTGAFKLQLVAGLAVAAALVFVAARYRGSWLATAAGIAGLWLWVACGFVGFGPV
jgi:hypothetical protein